LLRVLFVSVYSFLRIDNDLMEPYSPRGSGAICSRQENQVKRFVRVVPALCGALLVVSPAIVANAATGTPAAGVVQVYSPAGGVRSPIEMTGAIGDYGTSIQMTGAGKPSSSGNFVKMDLHKGTFKVNITKLNQKSNKTNPSFNQVTCSGYLHVTDPVTAFDGTGLYQGISGSIVVTLSFGFIGPRFTSGAHKGQCNSSGNAQPLAQWGTIAGSGRVRFS
jgi:hypothetical protein